MPRKRAARAEERLDPGRLSYGFSLIEMMAVLAILAILASAAIPMTRLAAQHSKEQQLQYSLRQLREAIDAYKRAADEGRIAKKAGESGYPPSLEVLTQPLEITNKRDFGSNAAEAPQRIVILRQLPRDPFFPDPQVSAAQTWNTRAYASRADDPHPGVDVFDVSSKSIRVGLDGTAYNTW